MSCRSKFKEKKIDLLESLSQFTEELKAVTLYYGFLDKESIEKKEVFHVIYKVANEFLYISDQIIEIMEQEKSNKP